MAFVPSNGKSHVPLALGSLCTGYGGLDLAAAAVFDVVPVFHAEVDPAAARVLEHRFPGVPNLGDITAIDWHAVPSVDVLCAGYPCQPESLAGQRKGADDARWLWPSVAQAVRVLRPSRPAGERTRAPFSRIPSSTRGPGRKRVRCGVAGARGVRPGRLPPAQAAVRPRLACRPRERETGRRACTRSGAPNRRTTCPPGSPGSCCRPRAPRRTRTGAPSRPPHSSPGRTAARSPRRSAPYPHRQPRHQGRPQRLPRRRHADPGRRRPARALGQVRTRHRSARTLRRQPQPPETEPDKNGKPRLSARFDEWVMALPDGWITDVPGITYNDALRLCGNGIIPAQAETAYRELARRARTPDH